MFSLYHNFKGRLNDTDVVELIKQLDYSLETYEDRQALIEEIIKDDFFVEYFDDFFKTNLNTSDALSDKNNVCSLLQKMTDYLLCSSEISEELKEKKIVYKFYQKEETFRESLAKDIHIEEMLQKAKNNEDGAEIIHFLLKKTNNKKPKKITVKESDYSLDKNTYMAQVLRDYSICRNNLTELKNNKDLRLDKEYIMSKGKIAHMLKEINADMLHCKISLSGLFGQTLRHPLPEGQVVDWASCVDYTNYKHIRALLYCNSLTISADNELSFLVLDLENNIKSLVKKKKINTRDLTIIKMIRQGYLQEEIAEHLHITQVRVNQKITQIAKNIAKEFALTEK